MNVEHINPFIEASKTVMKTVANIDVSLGRVYLKTSPYSSETLVVVVGLMGELRGQVIFSMDKNVAFKIASAMMMGMSITKLDEMSKSAIAESTNMILGNAATLFYNRGINIQITPPSLMMGNNIQISTPNMKILSIPLILSTGGKIEMDIALAEAV
ncbi:MAG: chemotaxis protein CheX [Tepidanaerobacteraceae bacterium]|jgi:chemotaxis protein CheX|nr:chemotaxis protein CheX [Tepidanaerobacter sp.]HQE06101.1 chemotaxis protein CheX [Tepidanaerobacteraceae bacterium]